MTRLTWIACLLVVLVSVQACKPSRKPKNYNEKIQVDSSAHTFIQRAIEDGNAEIKMAELALKKSKNKEVISLANDIIGDHVKAGKELKQIAGDDYAKVSDSLTVSHDQKLASLSGKTDLSFDKEYSQVVVIDHEKNIALFKASAASANKNIRDFVKNTLPRLESHLKKANEICAKIN